MEFQTRYDTREVAPRDRFSFWRESVCDSYVQLGCDAENTLNFNGMIDITHHSALSVSKVRGNAQTVVRRQRDIRNASDAFFLLSLQTAESCQVSQFGKCADLRPGDMALYSSSDPYSLTLAENFSQIVVQLPSDKLTARLPHAEMLTARKIEGQSGIGRLVRENILTFAAHMDEAQPVAKSLLQETLIDLIAAGLATQRMDQIELSSASQSVLIRAKFFIRNALGNPDLNRDLVAAQVGLSVRRLNEIFAQDGETLGAFIRRQRFEAIAVDLTDPRFGHQSISEIAFRHGVSNLQNFSTGFKAHFGKPPRDYRSDAKAQ